MILISEVLKNCGEIEVGGGLRLRLALETLPKGPSFVLRLLVGGEPSPQVFILSGQAIMDLFLASANAAELFEQAQVAKVKEDFARLSAEFRPEGGLWRPHA